MALVSGLVVGWLGGQVLTAVGLGVGGPHLAKGGGPLPGAAGAACLAGGLVLLGRSAGRAVRAVRRGGRLLVAAGALPTVAPAVGHDRRRRRDQRSADAARRPDAPSG